jgi:hypothetical protein
VHMRPRVSRGAARLPGRESSKSWKGPRARICKTEPCTTASVRRSAGGDCTPVDRYRCRQGPDQSEREQIADNVNRWAKRRSRPKGGAGVSTPFLIYTFHGLPGQRAKRARVNPACYLMARVRTGLILYRSYWADGLQFSCYPGAPSSWEARCRGGLPTWRLLVPPS